jgi:hypothetical protein
MKDMTGLKRLLLLTAVTLLACPGAAVAADPPGTYVVSACRAGDKPAPLAGWYVEGAAGSQFWNTCAQAGSFGIAQGGQQSWALGDYRRWRWDAPPDVAVAGVRLWRTLMSGNSLGYAFQAGDAWIDDSSSLLVMPVESLDLNSTRLTFVLGCRRQGEGCVVPDGPPPQPFVAFSRIDMVLRDLSPPEVRSAPTGSLLQAGHVAGNVEVTMDSVDRGGGLSRATLLLDGVRGTERSFGGPMCVPPYTTPVPCPLSGRVEISLDTASIPDGQHRVELELKDVAGNRTLVGPFPIAVRNHPVPVALTPGRLSMSRPSVTARYEARTVIGGALTDLTGLPMAGAQIEVASRLRMRGSDFVPAGPVVTDAAGRFAVPVEPGPARVFRFRYAVSEATADLVIPAPVKLAATPNTTRNGRSIRFSGRIPGTDATTRVELQAQAGAKWIPFRTVTLRNGRFSARYRFTKTRRTTRYRFRAVIHADANFPYTAGRSPVVKVLVRP